MKKRALKKTTAGKVKGLIEALVITWMGILHLSLDALKRVVERIQFTTIIFRRTKCTDSTNLSSR